MLEPQLSHLEKSELVRRLSEPELVYLFKHALVQDTARASLLNQERKRLHQLVGETLEELYPERRAELAPLLAQHFADAGDDAKTLEYATLAGDIATRRNANTEAVQEYRLALHLAQRLNAPIPVIQELFLKLGRVLEVKNEYDAARANYDEMMQLAQARNERALELAAMMALATIHSIPSMVYDAARAQELNDRALELARALDDKSAQATILWNLMLMHSRVGSGLPLAAQYGEEALQIARENNLYERLAYVLNDISPILIYTGEPDRGVQYNLEARAMWEEFQNLPMLSGNLGYAVMNYLALGDYDEAIAASEEAVRLSREINNRWNEAFAQTWIGEAYLERGDVEQAERVMLTAIGLGEHVFPPTLVQSRADLARLYADFGKLEQAIELGELALAAADQRFPAMRPTAISALAHAYLLAGNNRRAKEVLQGAPNILNLQDNPIYAFDATRAEIEMALAENEPARAIALTEGMLFHLRKNKMRQFQPEMLIHRALALMSQERLDEAATSLEEAHALVVEMDARWSLLQYLAAAIRLENMRGDTATVESLHSQGRALVESFGARTPEHLRDGFLQRAYSAL